jgi:hypothetical protein
MFNKFQVSAGIKVMTDFALRIALQSGIKREVEQQRAVFFGERDITNVLTEAQEKAQRDGKPFEPDMKRAEKHAEHSIEFGVGQRLLGAYAHYEVSNQLECIRHILLALDSVCCALGWGKASAYLNQQNRILFEMQEAERKAA